MKKKRVGLAADVHGPRATPRDMLAGRPSFDREGWGLGFARGGSGAPTLPRRIRPSIPRDLEAVCLKCLAQDPAERYATTADFVEDLERFLAGEPVLARPMPAWQLLWHRARRRPALATLALAMLCAFVLGSIGYIAHARRPPAADRGLLEIDVATAKRRIQEALSTGGCGRAFPEVPRPLPPSSQGRRRRLAATFGGEFGSIRDDLLRSWHDHLGSPGGGEPPRRLFDLMGYLELSLGDSGGGVEYWKQAARLSERGLHGPPSRSRFSSESCVFALARQASAELRASGGDAAQATLERAFGFARGQLRVPRRASSCWFWALRVSLRELADWRSDRDEMPGVVWCLERQGELSAEFACCGPSNALWPGCRLAVGSDLAGSSMQADPR